MKAVDQYFPVVLLIRRYKMVLTFEIVNEFLWCDHLNETYWEALFCGADCYAVQGVGDF